MVKKLAAGALAAGVLARPWTRIVVRDAPTGFLEQTVSYRVAQDKLPELRRFGRSVSADAEAGELAVRGDSEEFNILCLNLADDIAVGRRTAPQAREFYERTVTETVSGRSSPYLQRLLFEVPAPQDEPLPLP